jgi:Pectate lyase superfamily protein
MKRLLVGLLFVVSALAQPFVPPQPNPLTDYVSVKYYGAVGDGVNDDTVAIQTAINTGRPVYVPAGTYKITSGLTNGTTRMQLIGSGSGQGGSSLGTPTSKIVQATANTPVITVSGSRNLVRGLLLSFTSQQPAANTSAACLVLGNGGSVNIFDDLTMANGAYGIYQADGTANWNNTFGSIWVTGASISGVYLGGSGTTTTFVNLYIQNAFNAVNTAVTGATVSSSTNIAFTFSSVPTAVTTNTMVYLSGFDNGSGFNGLTARVTTVSGTTVNAYVTTTVSNPSVMGVVQNEGLWSGPAMVIGYGDYEFDNLDVEQGIVTSPVYPNSQGLIVCYASACDIGVLHVEGVQFYGSTLNYIIGGGPTMLNVRQLEVVSSGLGINSNTYMYYGGSSTRPGYADFKQVRFGGNAHNTDTITLVGNPGVTYPTVTDLDHLPLNISATVSLGDGNYDFIGTATSPIISSISVPSPTLDSLTITNTATVGTLSAQTAVYMATGWATNGFNIGKTSANYPLYLWNNNGGGDATIIYGSGTGGLSFYDNTTTLGSQLYADTTQLVLQPVRNGNYGVGRSAEINGENAFGTNFTGGTLYLAGGTSTGTGNGGYIRMYTSPAGASGNSANAGVERFRIDQNGAVTIYGGALNMSSHQINKVTDPSLAQDAVTLNYYVTQSSGQYRTLIYSALGGVSKAETLDITSTQSSYLLTNNYAVYYAVYLPPGTSGAQTLTGAGWIQYTKGSYISGNTNEIALYSYSGGTLTKVATSGNVGGLWSSANAGVYQKQAFTGTYSASPGLYFIGVCYNYNTTQTTQPAIYAGAANIPSGMVTQDFANSAGLVMFQSGQNSLPSSVSASSLTKGTIQMGYFFLY